MSWSKSAQRQPKETQTNDQEEEKTLHDHPLESRHAPSSKIGSASESSTPIRWEIFLAQQLSEAIALLRKWQWSNLPHTLGHCYWSRSLLKDFRPSEKLSESLSVSLRREQYVLLPLRATCFFKQALFKIRWRKIEFQAGNGWDSLNGFANQSQFQWLCKTRFAPTCNQNKDTKKCQGLNLPHISEAISSRLAT